MNGENVNASTKFLSNATLPFYVRHLGRKRLCPSDLSQRGKGHQ